MRVYAHCAQRAVTRHTVTHFGLYCHSTGFPLDTPRLTMQPELVKLFLEAKGIKGASVCPPQGNGRWLTHLLVWQGRH